jgi:metal-dependent amidase/aminoacylase/carboxypeptidase family protein
MVKEGVLNNPKVDVIFGLHINAQTEVGTIKYRPEGTASSDWFKIKNHRQTNSWCLPLVRYRSYRYCFSNCT